MTLSRKSQPHLVCNRTSVVDAGLITETQLAEALRKQVEWDQTRRHNLGLGWVKPLDFYQLLAANWRLILSTFCNIRR